MRTLLLRCLLSCAVALSIVELVRLPSLGAEVEQRPIGVVDLHVDLPYQVVHKGQRFSVGTGEFAVNKLRRGGVLGVVLPLYIPREVSPSGPRLQDLEESYVAVFGALLRTPPYRLPGCVPQARSVMSWLAFEGAAPLADHPEHVPLWVARGVRLFGLVHSYDNELAGSSGSPQRPGKGLTRKGRALIDEIHRYGGIVDVSHASDRATQEIVQLSKARGMPAVATHSNARALAPHARNLTDEQIRAVAQTGGVIGVNFHQSFLASHGRNAGLADLVRNVLHLIKVAGPEHVALGSDFEGGIRPVAELTDASQYQELASALLEAGVSRQDVENIFHKNALRVLCAPFPRAMENVLRPTR